MPRSVFNGTITFGLVNVPVKLYSATDSKTVRFREVHIRDGARIEHRRFCPREEVEAPYDDVVKGYEVAEDEYVVLTKEEIAAAAGPRSRRIEVSEFVDAADIDPVFYDRTYYLGAGDGGEDAYRLLREALEHCDRAGIGRMVFHNREYLVAVRSLGDVLALHTMRFHDEVVDGGELDLPAPARAPSEREIEMAGTLVDKLAAEFEADRYDDTYRAAVLRVIEQKAAGEQIERQQDDAARDDDDLMAALEASIGGSSAGGGG